MKKSLVLTGMMGVGKSTIGKSLAQKLSYNFIDIDKLIEAKEGCSINVIFKTKNESYFRKIEQSLSLKQLKKERSVISLGGGAFMNKSIRRAVKGSSISFWLDVEINELIKDIKKFIRPNQIVLLKGSNGTGLWKLVPIFKNIIKENANAA